MAAWGPIMIALAALAAFSAGCTRPATLPPPVSISRVPPVMTPKAQPGLSSRPAGRQDSDKMMSTRWSANLWQPDVPAREWTSIVIHHTATDRGDVASIHETHVAKKWLGIGYHFVIGNGNGMGDGAIEPTFRWREQLHGAHAGEEEYNEHGVGICLVGNFEEHAPTPQQMAAVRQLVSTLKREYGIPAERVIGHSEVKATACPGKHFPMAEVAHSPADVFLGGRGPALPVQEVAARTGHGRE